MMKVRAMKSSIYNKTLVIMEENCLQHENKKLIFQRVLSLTLRFSLVQHITLINTMIICEASVLLQGDQKL